MPDDPNNAEELLKRYAKERRERSSEFSLHPATRRLLQGEVKRQFGAPKAEPRWAAWMGSWRGRFAAVAALIAVIFAGVWFFAKDSTSPQQFAKATSPRVEKELFLARAERLAEPAPKSLTDLAKTDVAARGGVDRFGGQSRSIKVPAADDGLSVAQKPQSALDNVALYRDTTIAVAATNAFNYSLALAPAQNTPGAQGPPTAATQPRFAAAQANEPSLNAPQSTPAENAPTPTQLGTAVANFSSAANAPLLLADEARLAKQSSLPLQQSGNVAELTQPIRPPSVALSVTPLPQSVATPGSPVAAQTEEKLGRGDWAGLAVTAAPIAPEAPQRFYRSRNLGEESRVAQRNAIDAAAATKAESADLSGAVLTQFTVEQTGNRMRWRDADGSLYEGAVGPTVSAGRGFQTDFGVTAERDKKDALLRETEAVAQKDKSASAAQEVFFTVSGSNVTTRQLVTVNGRMAPDTNTAAGVGAVTARRLTLQPTPQRAGTAGFGENNPLMIDGTVRVGNSTEQRFQAVRAPR